MQIAPPPETWDEHTGMTPVDQVPLETETPTETLLRRTAQTKNTTLDLTKRVDDLHGRVDGLEGKIDQVTDAVQAQGKQNQTLIDMTTDVVSILKNQTTVTTTTKLAEVEVTKTRALSEIEVEKAAGLARVEGDKAKRAAFIEVAKKWSIRIGAIGAAIATGILSQRCG